MQDRTFGRFDRAVQELSQAVTKAASPREGAMDCPNLGLHPGHPTPGQLNFFELQFPHL